MIFSCPECEKKYILSASALGQDGRIVRCANCAHEWFQESETLPYQESESSDAYDDDYDDGDYDEDDENYVYVDKEDSEDFAQDSEEESDDSFDNTPEKRLESFFEDEEDNNYSALQDDEDEQPLEDLIKEISEKNQSDYLDDERDSSLDDGEELAIPQGVKPIADDKKTAPKSKKAKKPKYEKIEEPLMARLTGMMAALFFFAVLFIAAIFVKPQIVSAWPPAAAIYDLAGLPVTSEGNGLVIESLFAVMAADNSQLKLKGTIVNLKSSPVAIPAMKASFKLTDEDGEAWMIDPPQNEIGGNDSLEFTATYESPPDDVSMLNVTFVP